MSRPAKTIRRPARLKAIRRSSSSLRSSRKVNTGCASPGCASVRYWPRSPPCRFEFAVERIVPEPAGTASYSLPQSGLQLDLVAGRYRRSGQLCRRASDRHHRAARSDSSVPATAVQRVSKSMATVRRSHPCGPRPPSARSRPACSANRCRANALFRRAPARRQDCPRPPEVGAIADGCFGVDRRGYGSDLAGARVQAALSDEGSEPT
jgi:hypothetical protein